VSVDVGPYQGHASPECAARVTRRTNEVHRFRCRQRRLIVGNGVVAAAGLTEEKVEADRPRLRAAAAEGRIRRPGRPSGTVSEVLERAGRLRLLTHVTDIRHRAA